MLRTKGSAALGLALALGCGGGPGPAGGGPGGPGGPGSGGDGAGGAGGDGAGGTLFDTGGSGALGGGEDVPRNIVSMRIEPADLELDVRLGESVEQVFRAYATFEDAPEDEVDITATTVFYVPDNYLVASFPADGSGTLSTRVPEAGEPAQRGGALTVRAQAASESGEITTVTAPVVVRLSGERLATRYSPYATPELPADPASHFAGALAPARAPVLVYPNDGVLLPPNLGRLEVHFRPGAAENELFELRFRSEVADLVHYTRCYAAAAEFEPGSCAFFLTGEAFDELAASNQGRGPVTLSVRGGDPAGTFGESASFTLEIAEERVDGAVYYWSASLPPSILRFDFGSGQVEPEVFVTAADLGTSAGGTNCVGCHTLSRQGDKLALGLGGPPQARLVYIDDLSRPKSESRFFDYVGPESDPNAVPASDPNAFLNGSFDPEGERFVAVAPVATDAAADALLRFHDAATGERVSELELPVVPNNPDWSPAGDKIAFSAIGGAQRWRIEALGSGISYVERREGEWDTEPVVVVPAAPGKNRFGPTFLPGGELLLYSEVDQAEYSGAAASECGAASAEAGRFCNAYSDPGAKTWAVAAAPGATPVFLARAAAPGVADALWPPTQPGVGASSLMDTFPKPAPFQISHRGTTLGWYTVGSQRRPGLRQMFPQSSLAGDPPAQALLWMMAIDAGRVKDGEDGSHPGFFLPFQDLTRSNHMAQWTERIVSDDPPPPPPSPPPPAPPPVPVVR